MAACAAASGAMSRFKRLSRMAACATASGAMSRFKRLSRMAACSAASGPTRCDNPPNSLPGFTWDSCNTGTAAVQSTCTGGCDTSAGYTAAGSTPITATCNSKGVYNVTGQCIGSRKWCCPAFVIVGTAAT
jgi:hypothetical protein